MEADFDARVEDRLRRITLTPPPDYQEIVARMHFYDFQLTTPLHILTGIEADSDRRLTRLAVRILDLHRAGKALPATQDQAQVMLGDPLAFLPGGDHLSMIYERLSEDRFRLTIDPLSQISNFDDAARMPRRCKAAGCTAGTDPLIGGDTMIEPKRRIRDRTFAV